MTKRQKELNSRGVCQLPQSTAASFAVQKHDDLRCYQASKKQYFYGFKVRLLVTAAGEAIELFLNQGSLHHDRRFEASAADLPPGATLFSGLPPLNLRGRSNA